MSKLTDYMKEAKTLYLATIDNGKPSIRPVGGKPTFNENGFIELGGRLYFYTDNRKSMYRQMSANPFIAITFVVSDGFIRLTAKAVFENNIDAKRMMINQNKSISELYSANDGFFEVYYIENIDAHLYAKGQERFKLS